MAGTTRGNRQMGRGAGGDISRRIDLVAEKTVIDVLRKRRVGATIIGEECGRIEEEAGRKDNSSGGFVIMDGIDGTTNASRRIPFYCCSLAYAPEFRLSAVTHAAVIDLATGDLYHATKGRGAFCNGRRIRVSQSAAGNSGKDLVIGMSTSDTSPEVIRRLSPLMFKKIHIRQLGAIALEMCLLARGQLDACIDVRGKIRPTDIAAACLITREAGGSVYSGDGSQELDAALGVETRISLVATAHRRAFEELSSAGVFNIQQHT